MQVSGYKIRDARNRIQDAGFKMLEVGSKRHVAVVLIHLKYRILPAGEGQVSDSSEPAYLYEFLAMYVDTGST